MHRLRVRMAGSGSDRQSEALDALGCREIETLRRYGAAGFSTISRWIRTGDDDASRSEGLRGSSGPYPASTAVRKRSYRCWSTRCWGGARPQAASSLWDRMALAAVILGVSLQCMWRFSAAATLAAMMAIVQGRSAFLAGIARLGFVHRSFLPSRYGTAI